MKAEKDKINSDDVVVLPPLHTQYKLKTLHTTLEGIGGARAAGGRDQLLHLQSSYVSLFPDE
jgi:hypothetical protein